MTFINTHQSKTGIPAEYHATGGLVDVLLDKADALPDTECLVSGDCRYTYKQLRQRARAIAYQLSTLGVGAGQRLGLIFPNGAEFVASFFAGSGLGATIVPINPLLKSDEIAHILRDSEATCLIVHERVADEVRKSIAAVPSLRHVIVFGQEEPQQSELAEVIFSRLTGLSDAPRAVSWPVAVCPDRDLAALVYTSGTTGKPKGAMLTHAGLLFVVRTATRVFAFGPQDRCLAVLPLCHIYGLTVVMLGILFYGGSVITLEKFEAIAALSILEREKITVLPAVPTMYQFMLMELENGSYDLSPLRVCLSGAASLPTEIFSKIEESFGAPLVEGYGLTEVSCIATFNKFDGIRKIGSVGCPIDSVEVSIVGKNGVHLPSGKDNVGEIAVKGPNVMLGYYGQEEATAEAIKDNWFFTGDLAYRDEDNYFYIVGRKKELIIRGGQNIYPREIEEVISSMDDVVEVAVIGVPDKYMGERVKAFVVKRIESQLTEEEVKDFCNRHLASYKVPRLVEFIPALPRNSTGKILKRVLV